jgi:hypothetical protein
MPGELTSVLALGAFLTAAEPIAIPLLRHRAIDAPTACDPFAFPRLFGRVCGLAEVDLT